MGRTYKLKVKLHAQLFIELAINEVGKGVTTFAAARKYYMYYMSTSLLWWRIKESKGLMKKKKQVTFQSDVRFIFLKLH